MITIAVNGDIGKELLKELNPEWDEFGKRRFDPDNVFNFVIEDGYHE